MSGKTCRTYAEAMSRWPSTIPPRSSSRSTSATAARSNSSCILRSAGAESERMITARVRVCSGGSSVRRIAGRIAFGSKKGRSVEVKRSWSGRIAWTSLWRATAQTS